MGSILRSGRGRSLRAGVGAGAGCAGSGSAGGAEAGVSGRGAGGGADLDGESVGVSGAPGVGLLAEELGELVFAEGGYVGDEIDACQLGIFAALRGVKEDVFAVGRPGDAGRGFAVGEKGEGARVRSAGGRHGVQIAEAVGPGGHEDDPVRIRRPGGDAVVDLAMGEDAVLEPVESEDVQFLAIADEGEAFAVGRPGWIGVEVGALGEGTLGVRGEVVEVDARAVVALGEVDQFGGVG